MFRVSQRFGFNRVRQPWNLPFTTPVALNGTSAGWGPITIRQFIDQSWFSAAPNLCEFIRLRLQFPGVGTSISALYVGPAAAANLAAVQAGNLNARSLVPVKYQGSFSWNLAGNLFYSDITGFLWNKSTPLIMSWYLPAANTTVSNATGLSMPSTFFYRAVDTQDESPFLNVDFSKYSATAQPANPLMLVSQFDLGAG